MSLTHTLGNCLDSNTHSLIFHNSSQYKHCTCICITHMLAKIQVYMGM